VASAGMTSDPDGTLLAYYGANAALNPTASLVHADVRLATSADGLHFDQVAKVIDHGDRSVWGHGDEIHATLALQHAGEYYVYYVPNGTPQKGTLGYCRGSDRTSLPDCGPVLNGSEPLPSAGSSSVVRIQPDLFAFFISNRGTIDVYVVGADCLSSFGAPFRSYREGSGAVVTLDRPRRTWFMYSSKWTHIELKVAPAGAPDLTPPHPPGVVTGSSSRYDRVHLTWSESTDSDTGVLSYNVYRDGRRIGTTPTRSFQDSLLTELTPHEYEVRAVNLHGIEGLGRDLSFRTAADTVAPAIESVSTGGAEEVLVTFDEPISQDVGATPSRCTISGGVEVLAASVGEDPRTLVLTTTPMEQDAIHTLSVSEILDRATTPNRGTDQCVFSASAAAGLIGRWSMDQPSSPGTDSSGSGHHAEVFGRPVLSPGKALRGLELKGSEYLEIVPTRALEEAMRSGCTISAWVRPADLPPRTDSTDGAYAIFSGPGGLRLQYRFDGVFAAAMGPPRENAELTSERFDPGAWHHVALVLDAPRSSLSLYIDGNPVEGTPLKSSAARFRRLWRSPNYLEYHGRFRIGVSNPRFALDSNYFRGTLDEVRIYRRAMSESEIRTLP
jgi:hypothetical protein